MLLLLLACESEAPGEIDEKLTEAHDPDVDGDGWTIDAGDCDDHDSAVKPGAGMFATWSPRYQELEIGDAVGTPVVADFDGDGALDVMVPAGGKVWVFRGSGDGKLEVRAPIDRDVTALAAADFDNDGKADLAAIVGDELLLLRGDETFGFAPRGNMDTECVAPVAVAAATTRAFVTCADPSVYTFGIFDGEPRGGESIEVSSHGTASAAGDWDADGDLDLLVSGNGSRVATGVINLGDEDPVATELTAWAGLATVTAGDFDGDGDDDVVFGHEQENDLTLLQGDGAGGWSTEFLSTDDDYWDSGYKIPEALAAGDLDGDGLDDLLVFRDDTAWVRWGGDVGVDSDLRRWSYQRETQALGDLDVDGLDDVVVATSGRLSVHLSRGDGDFDGAAVLHLGNDYTPEAKIAADLDGDADVDFLVRTGEGFATWLGDGAGGFVQVWTSGELTRWSEFEVEDLDGDGFVDLLAIATSDGDFFDVFHGDGTGMFGEPVRVEMGDSGVGPSSIRLADLDADRDPDLLMPMHGERAVRVLVNEGGEFAMRPPLEVPDTDAWVEPAQLDDDGVLDLVVVSGHKIFTWRGNGDGTFAARDWIRPETEPRAPLIGDFDRDGIDDLAIPDAIVTTIYDAALTELAVVADDSLDVRFADFSGDGRADLLIGDEDPVVWLSDGVSFSNGGSLPTRLSVNGYTHQEIDADGDGDIDVLVGGEGQVQLILNQCR